MRRTTCLHCCGPLSRQQVKDTRTYCRTRCAYDYRIVNNARLRAEAEAEAQRRAAEDTANLQAWFRRKERIAAEHRRRQKVAA